MCSLSVSRLLNDLYNGRWPLLKPVSQPTTVLANQHTTVAEHLVVWKLLNVDILK